MPVLNPVTDPRVRAVRDLRAIEGMAKEMIDQAVNDADSALMPGGLAMVALAHVANLEKFSNLIETAERRAYKLAEEYDLDPVTLMPAIEDDDWEPPLQTLCFWSEAWRTEQAMVLDRRPNVVTEASFLRLSIDWAWEHEPRWQAFVKDVIKTRGRMEAILTQGDRPTARGVPCMYDECRGARLIRTTVPTADKAGRKIWKQTDWHCPRCKRSWSDEEYQRNLYAAIHREKSIVLEFNDATEIWCTVDLAAKRVGRPESTVRVWLHREQINELCGIGEHRRWRYVLLADVIERDRVATERHQQRLATMAARRGGSTEEVA